MKVEEQDELMTPVTTKPQNGVGGGGSARHWLIATLAFAAVAAIVISGILPRIQARNALVRETREMAIPTVTVVRPQRSAPATEVVLPANVQAYIDAPIYARTNGYLKKWYADIGTQVKAGQLLADVCSSIESKSKRARLRRCMAAMVQPCPVTPMARASPAIRRTVNPLGLPG